VRGQVQEEGQAGVEQAWQQREGTGEQRGRDEGAVLGLEAFEQRGQGQQVEDEVDRGEVEEGVGGEAVYWGLSG
jgi:hypothetical protein